MTRSVMQGNHSFLLRDLRNEQRLVIANLQPVK